ncbi:putative ABC transport system permease protein [Streptomyces aurantiacus]|uniref:ABC transporter permease n=1 Tax=Streptomyces aurantiacus TaxID=47760 RepID=UPI00278F68CD|nr:FtsX-like permease family protein [Streptomyces aurantiacus]MDQ0775720.1 putative ABC transport system permease protein [Streptomyces aurantiacus]
MNLFKRAWWRLTGHAGKTLMLVGLFFVICTLVLSGFLIQSAAARAADDAKQQVGAVATMQPDLDALIGSGDDGQSGGQSGGQQPGRVGPEGELRRSLVDKICASSAVTKCNYSVEGMARPTKTAKIHQPVPSSQGDDPIADQFTVVGTHDLREVKDFRNGDSELVSGHGISADSENDEIVIEERVAEDNDLKIGDTLRLRAGVQPSSGQDPTKGSKKEHAFEVVGIYKNGTPDSGSYLPAIVDPSNRLYITPDGGSLLNGQDTKTTVLNNATFTLKDPDDLARLKDEARSAGADLKIFPITVNDKQYRTLVGPITKTAGFASVTVWVVATAGTVILALIVASSLRERRKELGILLSLGEKKPRLLGQHLVETVACAVLAIGLAAVCSQLLSEAAGNQLLAGEVASAKDDTQDTDDSEQGGAVPGVQQIDGSESGEETDQDPIGTMDVRLGQADLVRVGATGLGIAALATLIPGSRVLRLNPRDILTKGD